VEDEGEEQEVVIPSKTPSRKAKAKVVKDDEEEAMVEMKKSTRGRPKAKPKAKSSLSRRQNPPLGGNRPVLNLNLHLYLRHSNPRMEGRRKSRRQ